MPDDRRGATGPGWPDRADPSEGWTRTALQAELPGVRRSPLGRPRPRLSVIIAPGPGWRRTIESLAGQTVSMACWETIVLTHPGQAARGDATDEAIRFLATGHDDRRAGYARAIAETTGDYVCFFAAGDEAMPTWWARLVTATGGGQVDVVRYGALCVGADEKVTGVAFPSSPERLGPGVYHLPAGTFLVRRGILQISSVDRAYPGPDRPSITTLAELLVRRYPQHGRGGEPAILRGMRRRGGRAVCVLDSGALFVVASPAADGRSVPARPPAPAGAADPPPQRSRRPALVSVVLPVHNGSRTLPAQLEALAGQDYQGRWELVVVDNRSSDGSRALAEAARHRFGAFRIVDAPERAGEGYARNAGVAATRGDLLAFCDADDVAAPGWLAGIATAAAQADLVGGALDVRALSPAFADEQPLPMPLQSDFLPFARGANCGIWRDVLSAIGGWNEGYRGGGEDMDLSWRVQLCGFRVTYAPGAQMHYRLRSGLGPLARQKWRYGKSGALLYRSYRHAGFQRRSYRTAIGNWLWLLRHVGDLVWSARTRRRWVRYAARLAGFAYGSLRHRIGYF